MRALAGLALAAVLLAGTGCAAIPTDNPLGSVLESVGGGQKTTVGEGQQTTVNVGPSAPLPDPIQPPLIFCIQRLSDWVDELRKPIEQRDLILSELAKCLDAEPHEFDTIARLVRVAAEYEPAPRSTAPIPRAFPGARQPRNQRYVPPVNEDMEWHLPPASNGRPDDLQRRRGDDPGGLNLMCVDPCDDKGS